MGKKAVNLDGVKIREHFHEQEHLKLKEKIMEDQVQHSVLVDHEIIVEGVVLREKKELSTIVVDGKEKKLLTHQRCIGDRVYEVKQISMDGKIVDETVNTAMSDEESGRFVKEWSEKWQPQLEDKNAPKSGGIVNAFRKFFN